LRSYEEYGRALELVAAGLDDASIARTLGIPRRTVSDWRRGRRKSIRPPSECREVHDFAEHATRSYAYLLGVYLGDGYISRSKPSYVLRVTLDLSYPGIADEVENAMAAVWPSGNAIRVNRRGGGCVEVCMRSRHWPCLFPQHGPGRKHEREIRLADWQRRAVDAWPEAFLRGLVQTDGCRFVARDRSGGKLRAYTRYSFSNRSEDINGLFVETCRKLGVHCTRAGTREIAIARRADVRRLDQFIGPKR
jgi:hypothetical protein